MLSMANGRVWGPTKSPLYEHGVAAYGRNIADTIGVAVYGG